MRRSGRVGARGSRSVASGNEQWLGEGARLHIVVGWIPADVADVENDSLLAEVLPPMGGAEYFRTDVAGLVRDRDLAVAGIFDDLALLHEDQRRPIIVAVPGHDAVGFDGQLAE